ncbi:MULTISPECIES: sensor histidine kinase [Rhodopseudomonas]|uniref:histidine kinase n=1 Tax=Rhodopseudomonas palustris TaxID=1076 RepID=A0A0D7EET3_RHOPL|nr:MULTISPECIES: sensor histidine kinase [Rhodopseudomonas]KIZ39166.1 hypothetical protein OO17_21255 [Rhodopseudomonas palustris]MDF3811163.1 sensor histidine kinase [Rhodopseudomonas sp. BAL398]WOK16768.1 sensor histidine kinase [Rhodopseudomonas sp. BAL398]
MSPQSQAAQADFSAPQACVAKSQAAQTADADLQAALGRERDLIARIAELERRHELQISELNHRLLNGLQSIASLLSSQSRLATPEAATQLMVAVSRIVAFGQVNRQLHLLDHQDRVEFSGYLARLCAELSTLLLWQQPSGAIKIEAEPLEMPTATAIPLSYIVNELVTNSVKYGAGNITIRLQAVSPTRYSLSVLDQGPGLPAGFDLCGKKGLGMRIVQSLVTQIAGELQVSSGGDGGGACFAVGFSLPRVEAC